MEGVAKANTPPERLRFRPQGWQRQGLRCYAKSLPLNPSRSFPTPAKICSKSVNIIGQILRLTDMSSVRSRRVVPVRTYESKQVNHIFL